MAAAPLPPGPPGRLVRGHLPDFAAGRLDYMVRCTRDYGDVVALRFGPRRIFLVNHPDPIEEVLVTKSRHFIKHFALRLNPLVLGKGLLTSEGDFWLRQRRLIQPAFNRGRLAGYAPAMITAVESLLASWKPGETRDISKEMMRLTLDIAARTLFGADASAAAGNVSSALQFLQESFLVRFSRLLPMPIWVPTLRNLRLRRAVRQLDDIIYGFIRQRRQSSEHRGDLLSILLHASDEDDGSRMTDKQVRDEAMTLFLAGHETTALALSWTWYLLATHPEAEQRLADEVRAVLGDSDRLPTIDDVPRVRFVEAVILESMRVLPPVYTIGREAIDECEIGGFRVPKGTTILMSQWVVHRDPRFFDEPEKFHPQRWLGALAQRLPKYAYFPFGGGPRLCVGNIFAMLEAVLVLAVIAQRYRFTVVPDHPVEPWATFTLRPKNGIQAVLTVRP
jgi:cytochrome P450